MTHQHATTKSRQLTTPKIVFLILAAAAPIGAITALTPLQYALGNGPGAPAAFVIAGVILLCFGIGYAAMARQITNTGGFYTFITRGLGKPVGIPGAFIAIVAYTATCLQVAAGFGVYATLVINPLLHIDLAWYWWVLMAVGLTTLLSYRSVDMSAKVVGVVMVCEIVVLLTIDAFVIADQGVGVALPAVSWTPEVALSSGVGIAMLYAFSGFVGFESAALYGEESKDPQRTIPRAIYASLALITVFYAFTSWVGVGASGADQVQAVATADPDNYWLNIAGQYVGPVFTQMFGVLLCTSLFAALLSLQNAASRYVFSLGRERVLPHWIGQVHPKFKAPSRASLILGAFCVVVTGVFWISGLDPYLNLMSSMTGLSVLGIIALQSLACVSIMSFFHFRRHPEAHWFKTLIAPLLGLIGLVTAGVLALLNFTLVTGTDSIIINGAPIIIVVAIVGGLGYAMWLKRNRPAVYDDLASDMYVRKPEAESSTRTSDVRDPASSVSD